MKYKIFVLAAIILLLITPALGVISEYEAQGAVAKYQHDDEIAIAYGPYTYMDHPYYYIEFKTGNIKTGVMFIDGISKEPITDKSIMEKIAYTHYALGDIDFASLTQMAQVSTELRQIPIMVRDLNNYVNENQRAIAYLNSSEQKKINDMLNILNKMNYSAMKIANTSDEFIAIGRDALNGNKSYDNAKKIMNAANGMARDFDEFSAVVKEMSAIDEEFDMSGELIQLEIVSDELRRLEQDAEKNVSWDVSSAESRINSIPGFGMLFAVCSLLIGGVLIKRRK